MRGVQWDHDHGILAPLAFVHRGRVGQIDLVEFGRFVLHQLIEKVDLDASLLAVDARDASQIAVENAFVVIVAQLHDLVAHAQRGSAALQRLAGWIDESLQLAV